MLKDKKGEIGHNVNANGQTITCPATIKKPTLNQENTVADIHRYATRLWRCMADRILFC